MAVAISTSTWKSKTGLTFQAFQWTGQAINTLPGWINQFGGVHASGSQLHVATRYGTFGVKLNDFVVQEPDSGPMLMTSGVFSANFQPGP